MRRPAALRRREAPIEDRCATYASICACVVRKLDGVRGRRGKVDRVVVTPNGYVWWVEFKRDGDVEPSRLQLFERAELVRCGQLHDVVSSFEEFRFKLDWILRLRPRRAPRCA